jgi:uncharacterized protein (TIGR02646 family)
VIRIRRLEPAPRILLERGAVLTAELCSRIDAGERPSFEREVYGAAEVKEALRAAQHDKCCFCEAKLGHAQFGDVEHFRPKAIAQQSAADPSTGGYYWLAYAWNNLYLSCEICNRRHKQKLFPLANPERRVSSHHRSAELEAEQPLFIDPGSEDPTAFIEYRREYAAPVAGSGRGAATLESLQLNRRALVERRRDRREPLRLLLNLLAQKIQGELPDADRRDCIEALNLVIDAAGASGEYSSMVRALLRQVAPWREDWAPPAESLLDALRADAARGLALRVAAP